MQTQNKQTFHRPLCVHNERGLFIRILVFFSYRKQLSHVLSHIQMRQAHHYNLGVKGSKFDPLYIAYVIKLVFWYRLNTQGQNVFSLTMYTLGRHYWASLIWISRLLVIPKAGWFVTLCILSGVLNYLATRGIWLALLNRKWCNHTGPISSDI